MGDLDQDDPRQSWYIFYELISQTLFDMGAGDHLDAQIRADYRRALARAIFETLPPAFEFPSFKRFVLVREVDISGISGTGIVAYGVQFPDGRCATRWKGDIAQTCAWDSIEHIYAIHGHNGATRIEWV